MIVLSIICIICLVIVVYFMSKSMDRHYNKTWEIYKIKKNKWQ